MKLPICCILIGLAAASPATEKKDSSFESDPVEYIKEYVLGFLDALFKKDNYESGDMKISKNSYRSDEASSRSNKDYEQKLETYIKSHDVEFQLPILGSLKIDARSLDNDELNFKLNYGTGVQEARKSKLKKIFIPILVFVLLKAITLVPLALGILSLKAWNSLQLSFFSFVVAIGLAIFQLCRKIANDNPANQFVAQEAWPQQYYAARSFNVEGSKADAQELAYSSYV